MKTTTIAASAIAALLITGAATVVFAHAGLVPGLALGANHSQNLQGDNHQDNQTTSHEDDGNETENEGGHFNLTAGSTLTFSNLTGHWVAFSHTGDDNESDDEGFGAASGNSTGTFTLTVNSSNSTEGLGLTITGGSFTINGTTYTVTGGNLTLNEGNEVAFGTGTASNGANFTIFVAGIHGNTTSSALVGAIRLDVKVGTSDFLVILGNSQGVAEDDGGD